MNKMDDAREASANRDRLRKPYPEELAKDLQQSGDPWPRTRNERGFQTPVRPGLCPECRDSVAHLSWDRRRALWAHERCGFTATVEELQAIRGES